MLFVKRTLPLIVCFITGMIMIVSFFTANPSVKELESKLPEWAQIIYAFTMILGALSLLVINFNKIQRKVDGYGYNIVLIVGFVVMATLGFLAPVQPTLTQGETYVFTPTGKPVKVELIKNNPKGGIDSVDVAFLKDDGTPVLDDKNQPLKMEVQPNSLQTGFFAWLTKLWKVMFDGIFKAASATMFSLLAFFVASASFRAFRVKSQEAALLMVTAFLVMIGNVPLGNYLDPLLMGMGTMASLKEWILNVPSSAAQSAILIGATLGYLSASLKILLGVERSYLGGE